MDHRTRTLDLLWFLLLFSFTVYAILDTFVIERTYTAVEGTTPTAQTTDAVEPPTTAASTSSRPLPTASVQPSATVVLSPVPPASPAPSATTFSTENSYSDGNISITVRQMQAFGSAVYVADVVLSSPEHLQTALANGAYGRNVKAKTSSIAKKANAVLAINGDYYGARQTGYVLRNGVLYRSKPNRKAEDLVIQTDGSFSIIRESDISAQTLLDNGAWNVLSFGPALLIDGKIAVSVKDTAGQAKVRNPRTAIGIVGDLHYLFVVCDGRTRTSRGLTVGELAQVLQELGATTAYNLDGGGSSTMVFQGKIVNRPTSNGKRIAERSVSDIVCILP